MKVAFYAPLKPISDPVPSGDREIARSLYYYFEKQGAEVFVLSEFRSRWFFQRFTGWILWLRALVAAYKKAKQERPDVFFTYHTYYKAPDAISWILARHFNKPYFIFEGMYARRAARNWKTGLGYLINKEALKTSRNTYCDKTEDYEYLVQWFSPEKIVYLPPSIDLNSFIRNEEARSSFRKKYAIASDEVVISCVAMLRADRKTEGVKFLLKALATLYSSGLKFRFIHGGGGDCFQEVKEMAESLLPGKTLFMGVMEKNEISTILSASDFFAFPGLDEGFGLVYVEAQAASLPVVAFDNGGIPDAVSNGQTAFLTPVLDEKLYCEALKKLILDTELRLKMSDSAALFSREKFDQGQNYKRIISDLSAFTS